jgi:hypothetical protein
MIDREISSEELAAVIAALSAIQPQAPEVQREPAWKLAMRRESVTPFDE